MTNAVPYNKTGPGLKKMRRLHILLAEDNLLNIKLASLVFAQYGLTFQVAENGSIAVEKIKNGHFDIVLMDMEMPVLNGYQATNLIRHELKNDIPIIALSAHSGQDEKEKCLRLGMNDYIEKPINETILFRSILNLTGSKKKTSKRKLITRPPGTAPRLRKICNLDYLIKITRGDKNNLNSILDILLKETPEEISILDEAIEKTNYVLISDISHKIRSSFSMLGISVLNLILEEMERLGAVATGIERIAKLNRRVHTVFIRAMEEVRAAVNIA